MEYVDIKDAQTLIARSEKHYTEYKSMMNGLTRTTKKYEQMDGKWVHTLFFDGKPLIDGKPILNDAATNLASAMDNIVSAMARQNGTPRNRSIYYPFDTEYSKFQTKLGRVEQHIGETNVQLLEQHYKQNKQQITHVDALRKLANTGKHWKLVVPSNVLEVIGLNQEKQPQKFIKIPANVFANCMKYEFEFYREKEPMWDENPYLITREVIVGLTDHHPNSPGSIFSCSTRYVKELIKEVEQAAGSPNS